MTVPARAARVGISCDFEPYTDSRGTQDARHQLNQGYVAAVRRAGGLPYILPLLADGPAQAEALVAPLDALVLSGGAFDIPPAMYGQATHPLCGTLRPERSAFELALLRAALARDLPVLGICAGMQLLAVHAGGTLHQDLSLRAGTAAHEQPFSRSQPSHPVRLAEGSLLAELFGSTTAVNSTHHQVVDALGRAEALAWAPDGAIEALRLPEHRFAFGVQWHPESMADPQQQRLYEALLRAVP
jgi:putative glutamine amidotransferase